MDNWVLIDGHSLAYRAFYALPPDLSTSSGQMTNAVYGFTSMLIKVLDEFKPALVIVAFDKGKPEFRTEKFAEYKAHRKPMPDELREQMDIIHAVLEALNIPAVEREGFEADDMLATLTAMIPADDEVFIVTGDRDALQLVDERVRVVANRKGITDIVVYDAEKVKERYGVEPGQVVDYLALKGDTSDNIPGVPGIGEKTAASLIASYESLDGVLEHLDDLKGGKAKKTLTENRESALLSRELARMRRDVPIEGFDAEGWKLKPWDDTELARVFDSLEFKKLYERLVDIKPRLFSETVNRGTIKDALDSVTRRAVEGVAELNELLQTCESGGELSVYAQLEGEGFTHGDMTAVSIACGGCLYRFDLGSKDVRPLFKTFLDKLAGQPGLRINCYRGKDIMVQCLRAYEKCPSLDFDIELASYLINPSGMKHDLESEALRHLDYPLCERPPGQLDLLEEERVKADEEMIKAMAVGDLVQPLQAEMNAMELMSLYHKVEMPLQNVLADMEVGGIRIDTQILGNLERELKEELDEMEKQSYELAGEEFNLNSPQQLSRILFEVLELPPMKRTKTGYATDAGVLTALREMHPIAGIILRYRELSKLLNTYVTSLPRMIDPATARLHASFNQTVTATGRLSSSNPNMQNIPVRTALGKTIRRAFLPTCDDGSILSADYSQIELRVMAHLSRDERLHKAFEENLDIHAATASEVFDVPFDEVTAEHRRRAKAINFGIIYGISPFGLAEQLGIDLEEADEYISEYFREYPGVRKFLDRQVEEAAVTGYVTTLLGRRREIPELVEGNLRMRRLGERLAFNTPIQGSAADIIKLAMLHIHARLQEDGYRSRMILQVHDELVFDVEAGELEEVREVVRAEMEGAYELSVPLKVDIGVGPTWYDVK